MTALVFFTVFCCVLALTVTTHLLFYRWGYRRGEASGRMASDNWWINTECEISRTREKIWKEEAQL